jgi:hypothetical protein
MRRRFQTGDSAECGLDIDSRSSPAVLLAGEASFSGSPGIEQRDARR